MRKLRDQNEISEYFTKFFKNPYQRNTEKRIRNGQKNFFISFLSPEFLKDYSSLYDFYLRNLLMMIVQKNPFIFLFRFLAQRLIKLKRFPGVSTYESKHK